MHRIHAHLWIGVNLLGSAPEDVVGLIAALPVGGIWSDDAGVDSLREDKYLQNSKSYQVARDLSGWAGLYFGGTAFKTQSDVPPDQLPLVARRAATFMDVVTSSGRGTGIAADIEKVRILREAIPDTPLGLPSGVTPENVGAYLPYVEAYLVATGIETARYSGILVPERTRQLAERIHAWNDGTTEK